MVVELCVVIMTKCIHDRCIIAHIALHINKLPQSPLGC